MKKYNVKEINSKFKNKGLLIVSFLITVITLFVLIIVLVQKFDAKKATYLELPFINNYQNFEYNSSEKIFREEINKQYSWSIIKGEKASIGFKEPIEGTKVRFARVTINKNVEDIVVITELKNVKTFVKDNEYDICFAKTGKFTKYDTIEIISRTTGEILVSKISMEETLEGDSNSNEDIISTSKRNDPILVKKQINIKKLELE